MKKLLIDEGKQVLKSLKAEHLHHEAEIVASMVQEIEDDYRQSTARSNLKKGDAVVMHTCMEASLPKYSGRIWICKTDAFRSKGHDYDSIFLEGFSGSFSAEFLQKVDVSAVIEPFIDSTAGELASAERNWREKGEENRRLRFVLEETRGVIGNAYELGYLDAPFEGAVERILDRIKQALAGRWLKVGDTVSILSSGIKGVLADIQYEHDRYQLTHISGWMYGISDLVVKEGEASCQE
ncbi:hypothetical protein [Paenibacillus lautus]|uniref:hypothetical protein n=1 Tax=Paenibacillus lautus TaxID=1401 RepID=UPI003D285DFB